jgi:hypothetical protein
MEHNNIIARYAEVQGITYEEAEQQVGAPTDEEILNNIQRITTEMIAEKAKVKLNREQRRRLQKKIGKKRFNEIYAENTAETISDEIKKLDYIELIQKLRKLNERESKENGTTN